MRDARAVQARVKWAQSCLHYYPALDSHRLYIYEPPDRLKQEILPNLIEKNALPDYIKSIPFNIGVPTAFELRGGKDINILRADGDVFQWIATGQNPSVIFQPSPPISKRCVVSCITETSAVADVKFFWNDGKGWSEEKSLSLNRKGQVTTTNFGYFPETTERDRQRNVEAIELRLVNPSVPSIKTTIRDLKVWSR